MLDCVGEATGAGDWGGAEVGAGEPGNGAEVEAGTGFCGGAEVGAGEPGNGVVLAAGTGFWGGAEVGDCATAMSAVAQASAGRRRRMDAKRAMTYSGKRAKLTIG